MKSFKEFMSLTPNETRYAPFVIRLIIELVVFGAAFLVTFFLIPVENQFLRLIPAFFVIVLIICAINFVVRCINVSDNRARAKVKAKKNKKKFAPISVSRDDFIFWLKNTDLYEELVIKSLLDQYNILEVTPDKGKLLYNFDEKDYDLDGLIAELEKKEYLNETITVCETSDHNKPEILLSIIKDLKKK